jgi:hypothetical protein
MPRLLPFVLEKAAGSFNLARKVTRYFFVAFS